MDLPIIKFLPDTEEEKIAGIMFKSMLRVPRPKGLPRVRIKVTLGKQQIGLPRLKGGSGVGK